MRHRKKTEKLGRTSSHKEALISNLAVAFVTHERIITTVSKSKALRPVVEKLITLGKRQDINARRQAAAILKDKEAVRKLFSDVAPRFEGRNGGYTRIVRLGQRVGDNAPMAVIELVKS
ncbi:MAG: 50S ribosomal protein L17 [Candidatus Abyssubacteria bacterium]